MASIMANIAGLGGGQNSWLGRSLTKLASLAGKKTGQNYGLHRWISLAKRVSLAGQEAGQHYSLHSWLRMRLKQPAREEIQQIWLLLLLTQLAQDSLHSCLKRRLEQLPMDKSIKAGQLSWLGIWLALQLTQLSQEEPRIASYGEVQQSWLGSWIA